MVMKQRQTAQPPAAGLAIPRAGFGQAKPSDEDLMAEISRGNRIAFATLYDRLSARVLGLIIKIVRDRQTSEDVLQDVFLCLWNCADEYNAALSSPLGWLMLLARRRAIDALRKRGMDITEPLDRDHEPRQRADGTGVMTEDSRRALRAMAQLPSEQSEAIGLAFHGGLTYVQIAELQGEPLGTIKTRIRLGMKKLREAMEREREVST